jgi:hypothetical protein
MYFVEDKRAVFLSVAGCPNVKVCLEGAGPHPCCEIVQNQVITKGVVGYDDFQVPEPWVGEIDVAPILFISSNPSIGDDNAALGASSNEALWDSHHYAFGGGKGKYIIDGIFPAGANGEKLKKVAYWVFARARARELIPDAVPGQDYALTEVVHCKSKKEIGVWSARQACWDLHAEHVLALSPAAVVIVVGKVAREFFLGVGAPIPTKIEERPLYGRIRLMAYLPGPASFAHV